VIFGQKGSCGREVNFLHLENWKKELDQNMIPEALVKERQI